MADLGMAGWLCPRPAVRLRAGDLEVSTATAALGMEDVPRSVELRRRPGDHQAA
jgi:hypothetical protein